MSAVEISSTEERPGRTKLGHAGAIAVLAGSVALTALLAAVRVPAKRKHRRSGPTSSC